MWWGSRTYLRAEEALGFLVSNINLSHSRDSFFLVFRRKDICGAKLDGVLKNLPKIGCFTMSLLWKGGGG